jgi:hypothetical protein
MICLDFLQFHHLNSSVIPKDVPKSPFLPVLYIHVFTGQSGEHMGHKQYNQSAYEAILAVLSQYGLEERLLVSKQSYILTINLIPDE